MGARQFSAEVLSDLLPLPLKNLGSLVGPLVFVVSFVCSISNVPLATMLWNGGISFGTLSALSLLA